MVDDDEELSVRTQCRLLGVTRSMLYYEACPESAENLSLMRRLDELHLAHPCQHRSETRGKLPV